MLSPVITLASATRTAAAADAGVAISALPLPAASELSLCLQVTELKSVTGTPGALFSFEDSADAFVADRLIHWTFGIKGPVDKTTGPITRKVRCSEIAPHWRAGIASATGRTNLQVLAGGTPSCTYTSWLE